MSWVSFLSVFGGAIQALQVCSPMSHVTLPRVQARSHTCDDNDGWKASRRSQTHLAVVKRLLANSFPTLMNGKNIIK